MRRSRTFGDAHGSLDIVICTPSINVRKKILDYQDDELDRVLDLNLKGNFNVLRAAGRIMTAQRRGSIVLFSSIRSLVVEPGQSVYAATKAGIVQLARAAACEFGPYGVRVNAVGPGVIETPLTAPIKNNPEWFDGVRRQERVQPLGHAGGDGRADAVPRVGRRQLRDGDDSLRRRRLAGAGRPVHAAGHVTKAVVRGPWSVVRQDRLTSGPRTTDHGLRSSLEHEPEPDLADALLGLTVVAGIRVRLHERPCSACGSPACR